MKRLISLILFLTMVAILIGCAGSGGAGRTGAKGNLTEEVGNAQFVGATNLGVPFQQDLTMKIGP
ncbi:MAG TPA: hypothetical protein VLS90_01800, partial [Thermodesulfobacteriota bacterium]|nr:hypothetical protein [Thermodesulfobacteriota bacterium]